MCVRVARITGASHSVGCILCMQGAGVICVAAAHHSVGCLCFYFRSDYCTCYLFSWIVFDGISRIIAGYLGDG